MPRIYRSMTPDGERPQIGNTARSLGVRPTDIASNDEGKVYPGSGGMSVAPRWRELELHRIPSRLQHLVPDAAGSNRDRIWRMGDGPFEASQIAERLWLRPDSEVHGVVEPDAAMSFKEYSHALGATREQWEIDEE